MKEAILYGAMALVAVTVVAAIEVQEQIRVKIAKRAIETMKVYNKIFNAYSIDKDSAFLVAEWLEKNDLDFTDKTFTEACIALNL